MFNPRLKGCPAVVLSNNDGCVVARSPETKALGVLSGGYLPSNTSRQFSRTL
ncbi:MAG: hypothetical protein KDJ34_17390 [Candidatus Competibacteraceae bacterium]|nr:hypothetical protein [Candidatus Competibacteraceae bacterium]MCP5133142.1 hypothetical protein [Gammaproteobacteria bacterium]